MSTGIRSVSRIILCGAMVLGAMSPLVAQSTAEASPFISPDWQTLRRASVL